MNRAFLVARRVIVWGLLGLLVLALIAIAINARDETLSLEAKALLHVPQNPYRPEQNIYVALAGFAAPASQSVVAAGQEKIARYNRQVDVQFSDPVYGLQNLPPANPIALNFSGHVDCGSPAENSISGQVCCGDADG